MEKYCLIFNGERCGDYANIPIEHHVKLLKISERARAKILLNKKVILKSGVPRQKVHEQKMVLEKLGLVTEQQLQLNADIFALGLRELDTSLSEVDLSLPVYAFDSQLKHPSIFTRPYDDIIQTTGDGETVMVETSSYQFNGFLLIAIAAFLGLTMQTYIVVLIKSFGFANLIASLIGIIFLLACVAMLPKLFQPLQGARVRLSNHYIDVYEQIELVFGKKRLQWETSASLGEFSISEKSAEASSVETLYQWNALHSAQETSQSAVKSIEDAITDGTIVETIQFVFEKLKFLLLRMVPRFANKANKNWKLEDASVVSNSEGEMVALIYQSNEGAYRIVRKELCEDVVLHAFCMSIHTAGLV